MNSSSAINEMPDAHTSCIIDMSKLLQKPIRQQKPIYNKMQDDKCSPTHISIYIYSHDLPHVNTSHTIQKINKHDTRYEMLQTIFPCKIYRQKYKWECADKYYITIPIKNVQNKMFVYEVGYGDYDYYSCNIVTVREKGLDTCVKNLYCEIL